MVCHIFEDLCGRGGGAGPARDRAAQALRPTQLAVLPGLPFIGRVHKVAAAPVCSRFAA